MSLLVGKIEEIERWLELVEKSQWFRKGIVSFASSVQRLVNQVFNNAFYQWVKKKDIIHIFFKLHIWEVRFVLYYVKKKA